MKKWSLRILIGVLALVLLLAAAVQIVLWTDLPRNWVLGALQEKLQLKVSAQSFSTGWRGRTDLSGVMVTLPLEQEALFQAHDLSIDHTNLLALIFGRPLRVDGITINKPNLLIKQEIDGRWNLQAAAELVRRAGGGKTPETQVSAAAGLPQLPDVTVNDAIVRLINLDGKQATLSPLKVTGMHDGKLVWKFDASIPGQLHIKGEAAPGGPWLHEASVELKNLAPLVRPFLTDPSPDTLQALEQFKLAGNWSGRASGNLMGRLDLSDFFFAGYSATGPLAITFNEGGNNFTRLTPAGVVITPPFKEQLPRARFESGTIVLDGPSLNTTGLTVALAGGELRLAGLYNWKAGEGNLQATWNDLTLPKGTSHGGTLTASIHQPWPNQPMFDVTLSSNGRFEEDSWTATLKLDGDGKAWDKIDWKLSAPALTYHHANQTYNLDNLAAKLSTRGNHVTLDQLEIPPGSLYGKWQRGDLAAIGKYDLHNGQWHLYLSGNRWPLIPDAKEPANFVVNLSGDKDSSDLQEFFVTAGRLQFWGNGNISYAKGMPLDLALYGWYPPLDYTWRERGDGRRESVHLSGHLWSELHLTQHAWPLDMKIIGTLYGKDFKVKEHDIGNLAIKVEGSSNPEHLQLSSTRLELLGGVWQLAADLKYQDWLTGMNISLKDLSLTQLDTFADPPPKLVGTMSGQWNLHLPALDLQHMTADGQYSIENLGQLRIRPAPTTGPAMIASLNRPVGAPTAQQASHVERATSGPVTVVATPGKPATYPATTSPTNPPAQIASIVPIADTVTGKIAIADGTVTLDSIRLKRAPKKGGDGIANAKITFPIFAPRQMHIQADAAAWPLMLLNTNTNEISNVLVWAHTTGMDVDLKNTSASGPIALDATIAFKDQTLGLHIDSKMDGRRIVLNSIKGDGLGGYIIGDGFIDLDHPLKSEGQVQWNEVDAQSIVELAPPLHGLGGKYSGTFRFSPTDYATDRDATGPFAFSGEIWSLGGHWKGMPVGDAWFIAHGDYQSPKPGQNPSARAVVDKINWNLSEGTVQGWSRLTWYDREPFAQLNLDFDNVSLDPIVRALRPAGQPHKLVPGKLAGHMMAAGNPFTERGQQSASGDVKIRLTESDLVNVAAVNLLYSIMSVKLGPQPPSGRGFIQARLEGTRLEVPAMRYSNRGAEIWANPVVVNIFEGANSRLEGVAAGSIRPLRDLKLPFMADIDKVISAWTGSIATVKLSGTLGNPKPNTILFSESGDTFRRFMLGEVKSEVRGTAGR